MVFCFPNQSYRIFLAILQLSFYILKLFFYTLNLSVYIQKLSFYMPKLISAPSKCLGLHTDRPDRAVPVHLRGVQAASVHLRAVPVIF